MSKISSVGFGFIVTWAGEESDRAALAGLQTKQSCGYFSVRSSSRLHRHPARFPALLLGGAVPPLVRHPPRPPPVDHTCTCTCSYTYTYICLYTCTYGWRCYLAWTCTVSRLSNLVYCVAGLGCYITRTGGPCSDQKPHSSPVIRPAHSCCPPPAAAGPGPPVSPAHNSRHTIANILSSRRVCFSPGDCFINHLIRILSCTMVGCFSD